MTDWLSWKVHQNEANGYHYYPAKMPRYARRRSTRRPRKRAPIKKYRKRTSYRRRKSGGMSRKRVLNIASRKKRNGMMSWTNTNSSGAGVTTAQGPTYVAANGNTTVAPGFYIWSPTAMILITANAANTIVDDMDRTSTVCYMRGLSEHIRYQTSTSVPWYWRRVCFTTKDPLFGSSASPTNPELPYVDTSNGIERLWLNLPVNGSNAWIAQIQGVLFKGSLGQDWNDPIIAPIDTSRVTLKYDKTRLLRSGNSNGIIGEAKLWHPMNSNLRYEDDETGASTTTKYMSVDSKIGMGNYFVVDIFNNGAGGTSSDVIRIDSNATMYWHEK